MNDSNGPFLIADLDLDNGQKVEVVQPIDGLTNTVIEGYEDKVASLEEANNYLAKVVSDTTGYILTDSVEAKIFAGKAIAMSKYPYFNAKQKLVFAMVGAAMTMLANTVAEVE